jgi:adenylylsulfate kinase-like enzyme
MVIWLTGLSGSGKTTLAHALRDLIGAVRPVVVLDGDAVRAAFDDGLGYSEADRNVQIGRMARIARLLAGQGIAVVVAALYASDELLAWNRANLPGYFEVHLDCPIDELIRRDAKGLYARAARGEIRDVVGVDIAWRPPRTPHLRLDMTALRPPADLAHDVLAALPAPSAQRRAAS